MKLKNLTFLFFTNLLFVINYIECCKTVSVSLTKEFLNNNENKPSLINYYVDVNIGTPPKPFKILLDTNAKETWLHQSVADSNSLIKEYSIEYQGSILTGKTNEDSIEFKNVSQSEKQPVSFRKQFLSISSASNNILKGNAYDGVINLNPTITSDIGTKTLLVKMIENDFIDELKFLLNLDNNLKSSYGGEIIFGGLNYSNYNNINITQKDVHYHRLANFHNRWELKLENVMFGGSIVSCEQKSYTAILSTGVNYLYGPIGNIEKIMSLLDISSDNQEINCSKVKDLPSITFNIDGIAYSIPASIYVKKNSSSSACYVAIFANKADDNQWTLGTDFLSNYYTVFDFNRIVGFASKK